MTTGAGVAPGPVAAEAARRRRGRGRDSRCGRRNRAFFRIGRSYGGRNGIGRCGGIWRCSGDHCRSGRNYGDWSGRSCGRVRDRRLGFLAMQHGPEIPTEPQENENAQHWPQPAGQPGRLRHLRIWRFMDVDALRRDPSRRALPERESSATCGGLVVTPLALEGQLVLASHSRAPLRLRPALGRGASRFSHTLGPSTRSVSCAVNGVASACPSHDATSDARPADLRVFRKPLISTL